MVAFALQTHIFHLEYPQVWNLVGKKKTGVKRWKGTMEREVLIWGKKWESNVEDRMWGDISN